MEAVLALVLSAVLAYACADALRKHPVPFYLAFAAAGAAYALGALGALPAAELALIPFLRRASIAFGLFTVVMFVGVLPEGAVRARLAPVRGQLALIGCILVAVHVLGYAGNYLAAVAAGTATGWVLIGLAAALATAALLAVLAVTSIGRVHRAMDPARWKRVQKLAYPFYFLMFAHLLAMLAPSSLLGGNSLANLAVYTLVVAAYAALRVRRGMLSGR